MESIFSSPERGPWGSSSRRGNTSGFFYQALFEQLKPRSMADPMVGSGTSVEVAREMGIEAYGLDLHQCFNAVTDSIAEKIGKQVDLCFSHPPYGSMILYSGVVYGDRPTPGDLSRCVDDEEFHEKMQRVLLNQREAVPVGGYYGCLIGDYRKAGKYCSYQAEMIARMPSSELAAVLIKAQHNCTSDRKVYANLRLPRIVHEFALLWKRQWSPTLVVLSRLAQEQQARLSGTWKNIVAVVLSSLGGKADLPTLYDAIARDAPEKLATNASWKAKIRQVVNSNSEVFVSQERGVWALA